MCVRVLQRTEPMIHTCAHTDTHTPSAEYAPWDRFTQLWSLRRPMICCLQAGETEAQWRDSVWDQRPENQGGGGREVSPSVRSSENQELHRQGPSKTGCPSPRREWGRPSSSLLCASDPQSVGWCPAWPEQCSLPRLLIRVLISSGTALTDTPATHWASLSPAKYHTKS